MYAVTTNGVLRWYRNKSYLTGVKDWEGPKEVGTGWQSFKTIFSPGDGVIYAMRPTGELLGTSMTATTMGPLDGRGRCRSPPTGRIFFSFFPE